MGAWQSLNFDKEYRFGFETLVFVTSWILVKICFYHYKKKKGKLEIASYDPFLS